MPLPSSCYPILDWEFCKAHSLAPSALLSRYESKGLPFYQLRAKPLNWDEYFRLARKLHERAPTLRILANDHTKALCHPELFAGLHIGQEDLRLLTHEERQLLIEEGRRFWLGISTHSKGEVKTALSSWIPWSYIAMGPCFPTASKPGLSGTLEEQELEEMLFLLDQKAIDTVVLIGGINATHISQLRERHGPTARKLRLQPVYAGISCYALEEEIEDLLAMA